MVLNSICRHFNSLMVIQREDSPSYLSERLQAIKILKKFLELSPRKFPEALARSLVAIASTKDDSFRKVCLETLRELCVVNPDMVSRVHGFKVLLDAIIDPEIDDVTSEAILLSILFLLNTSSSRRYGIDILCVLSPLTDLDSDQGEEAAHRWRKAMDAFIVIMKSIPGIIILTSDKMGLSVLIRMLTDAQALRQFELTFIY